MRLDTLTDSLAFTIADWTRKLPADMRTETDRILLQTAAAGASLDDLATIAGCAIAVRAVLEALGKKAGPEDDRTEEKRFHDALQLAWESQPRASDLRCVSGCCGTGVQL